MLPAIRAPRGHTKSLKWHHPFSFSFFPPFSFGARYGSAIKEPQVIAQFLKYEKMLPACVCRVPGMTVAVISVHCPIRLNMALAEAASLEQGSLPLSPDLPH